LKEDKRACKVGEAPKKVAPTASESEESEESEDEAADKAAEKAVAKIAPAPAASTADSIKEIIAKTTKSGESPAKVAEIIE